MIDLEGPEYREYVLQIIYLECSERPRKIGIYVKRSLTLPVGPAQQPAENDLKHSDVHKTGICHAFCIKHSRECCRDVSNGMVQGGA